MIGFTMAIRQYIYMHLSGVKDFFGSSRKVVQNYILHLNNDPKYTQKKTTKWLVDDNFHIPGSALQLPDLNSIEKLWI